MIHYSFRIAKELLDKVRQSAKENDRSLSGEIRHLLKKGLEK